jgi:ABC-2 type transport system ATP-binding protein
MLSTQLILALIPLILIELGLLVLGYVDLLRRERVRGGNKWVWAVSSGSVFGFLGPNGAGKTTTIKLLTGLLYPTSGHAYVAGEEIRVERAGARAKFGYLPEDPVFYNWMSARELLTYAGQLFGMEPKRLHARVEELLALVDLSDVAKRRVGGFSRGMRQRLGVAQAMVHEPSVLILDEPASALDPLGRRDVLSLIQQLRSQGGITVFMSTHILADVERTCDTVGIINEGKLVTVADQEELREQYAAPLFIAEVDGHQNDVNALGDRLKGLPWVERVERTNHQFRIFAQDGETARRELPGIITASPLVLLKYEVGLPSLEDVFLRLLGKAPTAE